MDTYEGTLRWHDNTGKMTAGGEHYKGYWVDLGGNKTLWVNLSAIENPKILVGERVRVSGDEWTKVGVEFKKNVLTVTKLVSVFGA